MTTATAKATKKPLESQLTDLFPITFFSKTELADSLDSHFAAEPSESIKSKVARVESVLEQLLLSKRAVCVSWSAGKDSSAMLNLLVSVAARLKSAGHALPPIVVSHADTLIENPASSAYARNEMKCVRAFSKKHGLDLSVEIAYPSLSSQWAVRVIGGRALPTFPGTNRDCTSDYKILPMKRLRKAILQRLKASVSAFDEPVVLVGTRYGESTVRGRNMASRKESDIEIRRGIDEIGKPTDLFLSPIAYWTTDDVWEYLALAGAGEYLSYSTFEETFRIYADSMATSCVIVAEDMARALKTSKACGARTGCSLCTAVGKDQSMENMLSVDPRYDYMRGLNKLRNFLMATRWDMDRRSWLGRTIKNGYVRIGPDAYSPAMMEELLRYSLSIDMQERESAASLRIRPRFQLVSDEALLAIDAMWSLQAFHRPFHALKIHREIVEEGARIPIPEVAEFAKPKEWPTRYMWVGRDWEDGETMMYTGLRSVVHDLVAMDSEGCMGLKALKDGRKVMDIATAHMLEMDMESGYFLMDDADRLIAMYHDDDFFGPTSAYSYYVGPCGPMSIKEGMQGEIDEILRRSSFKVRNGLDGQRDKSAFLERSVSAQEAGFGRTTMAHEGVILGDIFDCEY